LVFPYSDIENVHFIGICGVAMAAVAAELQRARMSVTGSDKAFYPPMSNFLKQQSVPTLQGFRPDNIPDKSLIVVGNSVSRGNPELEHGLNKRLPLISLPELIANRYLAHKSSVVVTGTHGKTTTTTMLAHILRVDHREPGWMIGGIPADLPVPCHFGTGDEFVIEGDEYDIVYWDKRPKFLLYRPRYAIINSVEFDHADIYDNIEAIELQFRRFVRLLPENGVIVAIGDNTLVKEICEDAPCIVITVGVGNDNDWRLEHDIDGNMDVALIVDPQGNKWEFFSGLPGKHNLMNGLAATVMAINLGVKIETALSALKDFKGVARRLETVRHDSKLTIYDDFAHHPTAIATTLETVVRRHPDQQIWALLEPRSNTMVRNHFTQALIDGLKLADVILIGKVHRSDSIPLELRLDRKLLVESLKKLGKQVLVFDMADSMISYIQENVLGGEVLVMMSNGSFDGLRGKLTELKL